MALAGLVESSLVPYPIAMKFFFIIYKGHYMSQIPMLTIPSSDESPLQLALVTKNGVAIGMLILESSKDGERTLIQLDVQNPGMEVTVQQPQADHCIIEVGWPRE
jgi:hypothetical protein